MNSLNNTFDVFTENEYYMLLLVDELQQRYEDECIITCFDLFAKLKHENKRIWVNIRNRKGALVNSFFVARDKLTDSRWNCFLVSDYLERGFYDKYYIVNCMNAINFQRWHIECDLIAAQISKRLQEKKKAEELERLYGKQYNIFGGLE